MYYDEVEISNRFIDGLIFMGDASYLLDKYCVSRFPEALILSLPLSDAVFKNKDRGGKDKSAYGDIVCSHI